jgi:hypothetical protein
MQRPQTHQARRRSSACGPGALGHRGASVVSSPAAAAAPHTGRLQRARGRTRHGSDRLATEKRNTDDPGWRWGRDLLLPIGRGAYGRGEVFGGDVGVGQVQRGELGQPSEGRQVPGLQAGAAGQAEVREGRRARRKRQEKLLLEAEAKRAIRRRAVVSRQQDTSRA